MAFRFTEEQVSLWDTVKRSFRESYPPERLRSVVDAGGKAPPVTEFMEPLGLLEFFSDTSASSLLELALVAFSAGHTLIPGEVSGTIYFGPFLTARLSRYARVLAENGVSWGDVNRGSAVVSIAHPRDGFYDFCSTAYPACIVTDVQVEGVKVAFPREVGTHHHCLDLSSPRYRCRANALFEVGDESGRIAAGWSILVASELSGIAARVVEMTREYVLTRKQFGVPVGSFQAVQQQLSEAYLKSEATWALAQFAAWAWDNDPSQSMFASQASLEQAVNAVPSVCEAGIQLHGGIGFTWEYDLHLYLRRARTLAALFQLTEIQQEALLRGVS